MPPRDYTTLFLISWDSSGTPNTGEWLAWLDAITPVIYWHCGEMP